VLSSSLDGATSIWVSVQRVIAPTLPEGTLLVRTDFTDDDAWDQARDEATREYGPDGYRAYIEPVSDPRWADATWEAVKEAAPVGDDGPCVLFIADSITFASPEHPILVVDLDDKILSVAEFPDSPLLRAMLVACVIRPRAAPPLARAWWPTYGRVMGRGFGWGSAWRIS
jgi:hypothetical protein